jgi:hypothetical protein
VFSLNFLSVLQQTAQKVIDKSNDLVSTISVVQALLEAEKSSKKNKIRYSFSQLIGTWELCFITGTKKARKKAGIVLGAGRYLPKWLTIKITYSKDFVSQELIQTGKVENIVELGGLTIIVQGPVKFLEQKNILAFDFTRLIIKLSGKNLYQGYIRGGKKKEDHFYQEKVGKQAFFTYFLVDEQKIAARGKGGGLALWIKTPNN